MILLMAMLWKEPGALMNRLSDAESAPLREQRPADAEAVGSLRRAHLIFNPMALQAAAGQGSLDHLLTLLRAQGLDVAASSTTVVDPGDGIAAAALAQQPDLVVVAGGDGTIHAVARALLHSRVPLGIIPLGTVNNLADALGIPTDVEAACALIATGRPHAIDAGLIDGRPFFEAVSLGVAAPFFPLAEATRHQGLGGLWRALTQGIPLLLRAHRTVIHVHADSKRRRYKAWELTVTNIPTTALRFAIAPDAKLDDGRLDVVVNAEAQWRQLARDGLALLRGGGQPQPYVRRLRARHIRLRVSHDAPEAPITIDGETMGLTPATITVARHALTVIVAPHAATLAEGDDPAATRTTPLAEFFHSLTEPQRALTPTTGPQRLAAFARRSWAPIALATVAAVVGVVVWRRRRRR